MKDCFHEKCNNEQPKNMLFFLQILKSLRYSYVDVAKKAGITPQLVAYWVDRHKIIKAYQDYGGFGNGD